MKTWILALAPWMAIANSAAQSDAPRSAEVAVTHYGKLHVPAWQIGLDCYVQVSSVTKFGWRAKLGQYDATLTSDNRSVTLRYRIQGGQAVINVGQAARKFGGGGDWVAGTGIYQIFGFVRSATVRDGLISLDSTLPIKPQILYLNDPPRMVLEFQGLRLDSHVKMQLSEGAKVIQYQPNVVRLSVETTARLSQPAAQLRPARVFELNYTAEKPVVKPETEPTKPIEPPKAQEPPDQQNSSGGAFGNQGTIGTTAGPGTEPPAQLPIAPMPSLVAPRLVVVDQRHSYLQFRPSAPLLSSPQIRKLAPETLELVLPGVQYTGEADPEIQSEIIESIRAIQGPASVTFVILCKRPMGIQISGDKLEVKLQLFEPNIGDGRLISKTVVIDAGHGGKDSGARAPDSSAHEKNLTLAIAKRTAEALMKEGATVIVTRNSDVFIPLAERPAIANRSSADFFISIHINSNTTGRTSGGMAFYHMRDPISQLLGECIQEEIVKVSQLKNLGVWSDSRLYSTGLAVLRYAEMPAVLLEMGFINHAGDRNRMLDPEFHNAVAGAIVKGLKVYLGDESEPKKEK